MNKNLPETWAVVAALLGALVLAVTFVPAAVALLMRGRVREQENLIMRAARHAYAPTLRWVLAHPVVVLSGAVLLFAGSL